MKTTTLFLALIALLSACHDKITNRYYTCMPVYTDYETFREPVKFESAKTISKNGNIYIKDNYLFVVEPDAGIHIIDNANPSSPNNLGFLNILGCTGMSIKDNYLYANSFIDLVVVDIASINNPTEVSRIENIFPQAVPVMEKNYPVGNIDKNLGVVTSWRYEETKEKTEAVPVWNNCINCIELSVSSFASQNTFDSGSGTGTSGSITKFTIINEYLYVMDYNELKPINISNPTSPVASPSVFVWRQVETLFPHNDYIFMGTTSGMLIYNTTNPDMPEYVSAVDHMTGCDPVVVQGNYCYVTIRTGNNCAGDLDQLDVIDISNIQSPVLLNSFDMENPHGLGISGNSLFVCDGKDGLKIFDATNPSTCGDKLVHQFKNIEATDIIPFNNLAIVIGEDGIYQYDYSDLADMKLLSSFKF